MSLKVFITLVVAIAAVEQAVDACCAPDQWEGMQTLAAGYANDAGIGQYTETYEIAYDAKAQKIAKVGKRQVNSKDKIIDFKIILDYQNKIGYNIHTRTSKCTKYPLTTGFQALCSPPSATVLDTSYFGIGEERLDVRCYEYPVSDSQADLISVPCVTTRDCVPVTEDIVGSYQGTSSFANINTYSLTPGIKDPSIFTPPANCEEDPFNVLGDNFFEKYSFTHPGSKRGMPEQPKVAKMNTLEKLLKYH